MSEKKERIAFFDTKPYDRKWFDQLNQHYHIKYYDCLLYTSDAADE